jgi:hypothetical protein
MLYAAHQPDLLAYSGFWYKMAKADVFDLKIWDQYVNRGYQRRVTMRDHWTTLPLEPGSSTDSIFDKRVKPEAAQVLADCIVKRYSKKSHKQGKFWDQRGDEVVDMVSSITTDRLWQFNLELILFMRDKLGITTPLGLGQPVQEGLRGSAGLISAMQAWPDAHTYLSGTGARVYMGDCAEFTEAGIEVVWSAHDPVVGDSILDLYFDYENPMALVLREKTDSEESVKAS